MLLRLLAISASAALLAGAAQAQTTQAPTGASPPVDAASPAPTAPVESTTAPAIASPTPAAPVDTTGYNSQSSAAIPASTSTLGDPATLKAGDAGVVSNGPVPDTRENRAKYGRPDSSAGKHTAPAGN